MTFSAAVRNELGRALRSFKYEKSPTGVVFPQAGLTFGGVFGSKTVPVGAHSSDFAWEYGPNAVSNDFINDVLNAKFNNTGGAIAWYFAAFANNVAPTASLSAATFAGTQGEYAASAYTQGVRQPFVSNGVSTAQTVSNSSSPAAITVGATAITPYGAGILSVNTALSVGGALGAAGLFASANVLSPGSQLMMTYSITGTSM